MNFNFEVNDENSTNVKDEWDRHDGNPLDKVYVNDISNETIFDEDGWVITNPSISKHFGSFN